MCLSASKGVRASVEPTADGGGSKVGVIKITSFSTNTAESVQAALPSLSGVSAIVLDLRANAGGFLGGGVDTARLFLPNNARITAVAQSKGQPLVYDTVEEGAEVSTPLLVLADEKTASASEVGGFLVGGSWWVVGGWLQPYRSSYRYELSLP